jgi:membrane-bound serine protease (ClpP class)
MWSKQMGLQSKTSILTILLTIILGCSLHAESVNNKSATKIFYIHLSEEIQPAAGRLIKKSFEKADKLKVDKIIIEINTYGGRLDIADSIRTKILNSKIPTIAFINNNAASAGALISLACDSIYMAKGGSIGAATVVNGSSGAAMPDKYQSYMRSMMRSTAETKGRNPDIAEAMVDERKVIEGINDSGKVLTLTSKEAVKYKIADGIANNMSEVIQQLNIGNYTLIPYKISTTDKLINILLNPIVNSILIFIIIGGLYFEFKAPGLGIPILISLMGAILFFAPLMIDGTANVWEILLFVAGVILLILEIFVIPGFGVVGIAGIICIVSGLTFSLLGFDGLNFEWNSIAGDLLAQAFFRVMVIISIAFTGIFFFGQSLINLPGFNKLVLKNNQESKDGFTIKKNNLDELIGKSGIVLKQLRPSGKIIIEGNIYDAISITNMVEIESTVKVIAVEGNNLKVSNLI